MTRSRTMVISVVTLTVSLWVMLAGAGAARADSILFVAAQFDQTPGVDGLDDAHAVVVSPDGKHVYVAAAQDDAVAVFSRAAATGELTFVESHHDGVSGVEGLDGTEALALDPGGSHLYVAGLLDNALAVFARNAGTGGLTFVEVHVDNSMGVDGLAGASSVAVSPDGKHVYVAGRFDDAVSIFQRNTSNGRLTFAGAVFDGVSGVDGLGDVTAVVVSPDGAHVYAAGVTDQAVAAFARNSATGGLTFLGAISDTLPDGNIDIDDHRSLSMSPDGAHLYVGNHVEDPADGWIATFSRNAASGLLSPVSPVLIGGDFDFCFFGIEGDTGIAVSDDGTRAWANLTFESAVALFARDPATGRLTLLDAVCDETIGMSGTPGEVDGLWGSQSVALAPGGGQVYVASGNLEDAVATLVEVIFADGFESGDTTAWSSAVP